MSERIDMTELVTKSRMDSKTSIQDMKDADRLSWAIIHAITSGTKDDGLAVIKAGKPDDKLATHTILEIDCKINGHEVKLSPMILDLFKHMLEEAEEIAERKFQDSLREPKDRLDNAIKVFEATIIGSVPEDIREAYCKLVAHASSGGICELCGGKVSPGKPEEDEHGRDCPSRVIWTRLFEYIYEDGR